jgi:hypothetical protein
VNYRGREVIWQHKQKDGFNLSHEAVHVHAAVIREAKQRDGTLIRQSSKSTIANFFRQ